MYHHAGRGIFSIGFYRTADQARGLQAMIAAHRQVMPLYVRIVAAFEFADAPPVDRGRIAVLLAACNNATFAANALGHVEVKAILFSGLESALRDQRLPLHLDMDPV